MHKRPRLQTISALLLAATAAAFAAGATRADARVIARGQLVERFEGNCVESDTETPDGLSACSRVLRSSGQVFANGTPTGCDLGAGRARWAINVDRLPDDSPDLSATAKLTGLPPVCDGLILSMTVSTKSSATSACVDVDPEDGVCTLGFWRSLLLAPANMPAGSTCTVTNGACALEIAMAGAYAGEMSFLSEPAFDLYYLVPPVLPSPIIGWRYALSAGLVVR